VSYAVTERIRDGFLLVECERTPPVRLVSNAFDCDPVMARARLPFGAKLIFAADVLRKSL
jgi:hypothetical protein